MDYVLRYSITYGDIEFINNSSMDIFIYDPRVADNDSGWCDASTGHRIITGADRVIFRNVSEPDLLMLKLKYGDRIKELHDGMKSIYNIDKL